MAEIKIQRKKRPIWPWIILLLIIAAAVILFVVNNDRDKDDMDESAVITDTVDYSETYTFRNDTTSEFINYVRDSLSADTSGSGFVATGFQILNNDLKEIVKDDSIDTLPMNAKLDSVEMRTRNLSNEGNIHNAAMAVVDVLVNIQIKKYPNLQNDMQEVRYSADAIDNDRMPDNQKKEIIRFFNKTAILMDKMKAEPLAVNQN